MKKPEIEVVRFGAEDVIATSGAPKLLTWSNLGGETKGDSIVRFGSNTFGTNPDSHSDSEVSNILDALGNYYNWTGSPNDTNVYFSIDEGKSHKTLSNLWTDADAPKWAIIPTDYNTTYWYKGLNNGFYWFYKQK